MPVLVAVNGSWHTEAPLRLGIQVARRIGEPLTILLVVKPREAEPSSGEILVRARHLDLLRDVDLRVRVRVGDPAAEIIREADEGLYDLVVVGELPSRNVLARFLQGTTALRVVEHAPCPVLVAKGEIGPIQRILLCDSGSDDPSVGLRSDAYNAKAPASAAAAMLQTGRPAPSLLSRFAQLPPGLLNGTAEVVVLHVMSQMSGGPGVTGEQLRSDTEKLIKERAPEGELLGRDIEALERLGLHARARVRHGLVVEEILAEARSENYDLVVIGAYRGKGWQRILLDDLTHRIVAELDRTVLVV
jgi:nucleotide-binding universal stress UspA family protein